MARPLSEYERTKLKLDSVNLAVSTVAMGAAVAALCLNEKGESKVTEEEKEYRTRRELKRDARREIKRRAVTQIGYPGPVLVLNEGGRPGPVWHPYVVPRNDDTRRTLKRRYAKEIKAMAVNEVGYPGPVILLNKEPEPWVIERADGRKAKIYMSPKGGDDVWTAFGRSYPQGNAAAPDNVFFSPWHGESVDRRFTQDEDWELSAWLMEDVRSWSRKPAKRKAQAKRAPAKKTATKKKATPKRAAPKKKAPTKWVAMQMTRSGGDAQAVVCRDRGEAESRARAMKRSRSPSSRGRYVQGYARMDTSRIDVPSWANGKKGTFHEV